MALLESYIAEPPPLYETEQGAVRVRGTRVSLDSVIHAYNNGATPEDIVQSFTTLKLRDVYAVITYYLDHREIVEAYIARREAEAAEIRRKIEANQPSNEEFRARLQARLAEKANSVMVRFLTDEDFNNDILRGVLRHLPELDIVRVQDVGLMNVQDAVILAWAAQESRIMLTHDASTMIDAAYQRVREELPMPGMIAVRKLALLATTISDLVFMAQAGTEADFQNQVRYVPL